MKGIVTTYVCCDLSSHFGPLTTFLIEWINKQKSIQGSPNILQLVPVRSQYGHHLPFPTNTDSLLSRFRCIILANTSSVKHETEITLISSHLCRVVLEHLLHLCIVSHTEMNRISFLFHKCPEFILHAITHTNYNSIFSFRLRISILLFGNKIHFA